VYWPARPGENHRWRGLVTPAKRGKGVKRISTTEARSPAEIHVAMTGAQRLKHVFSIDIEVCGRCGGSVRVIPKALATLMGQALACIEEQETIDRILAHLRGKEPETSTQPHLVPPTRAPPGTLSLFAGERNLCYHSSIYRDATEYSVGMVSRAL
jgi:hypothetical protein